MSAGAPTIPDGTPYIGYQLKAVAISFTVLEIIFVGLRYVAQRLNRRPFGIDDWLILPALVLCIGLNISALIGLKYGRIGYHMNVVARYDPSALVPWAKILVVTPIIYSAACCMPKLVILTLYNRVFVTPGYRIACYTMMGIIVAVALADMITGAAICTPLAYLWDKKIEGGHCINIPAYYRWGPLPNAITDLMMLVLPFPVVWNLNTTTRIKIGLTVTFLTGSVGMITSILRCVAFFLNNPLEDGTWQSVIFLNWSLVEPGVYLIAACLPCYRSLLRFRRSTDAMKASPAPSSKGDSAPGSVGFRSRKETPGFDSLETCINEGDLPLEIINKIVTRT